MLEDPNLPTKVEIEFIYPPGKTPADYDEEGRLIERTESTNNVADDSEEDDDDSWLETGVVGGKDK